MTELRDYQQRGKQDIRAAMLAGYRRIVYVLPTGGGKSVVFADMTKAAHERKRRTLFLVHRNNLVEQARKRIGDWADCFSVQSWKKANGPYDFIISDEAHNCATETYTQALGSLMTPNTYLLGFTATPQRLDGKGLGSVFQHMVLGPTTRQLVEQGWLACPRVFTPSTVDLKGVPTIAGEYQSKAVIEALQRGNIVGDSISHYRRLCDGGRALAFGATTQHADDIAAEFNASGIPALSIHGRMSKQQIADGLGALETGRIMLLSSCDLIGEGTDIPAVEAVMPLRATKSLAKWRQWVGRGMRLHPGKSDCIVLDHCGNFQRHGHPLNEPVWTLDDQPRRGRVSTQVEANRQCPKCYYCQEPQPVCENCGYKFPVAKKPPKTVDGELIEMPLDAPERVAQAEKVEARATTLTDWHRVAKLKGKSAGWAYMQWKHPKRRVEKVIY